MGEFRDGLRRLAVEGPIESEARRKAVNERMREKEEAAAREKEERFKETEKKFQRTIIFMDRALSQAAKSGRYAARFDVDSSGANRVSLKGPYELVDTVYEISQDHLNEGTNERWNFVLRVFRHYSEKDRDLLVKLFEYSSSYGDYRGSGGWHILISWK